MSDLTIMGVIPEPEEGKEFFLYCTEVCWDMIEVFNNRLMDIYSMNEYFKCKINQDIRI